MVCFFNTCLPDFVCFQGLMKPTLAFNSLYSGRISYATFWSSFLNVSNGRVITMHDHAWLKVSSFVHWVLELDFPVQLHISKWLGRFTTPNCFFWFSFFSLEDHSAFYSTSHITLHLAPFLSLPILLYSTLSVNSVWLITLHNEIL